MVIAQLIVRDCVSQYIDIYLTGTGTHTKGLARKGSLMLAISDGGE